MAEQSHSGHRERMRDRFRQTALAGFLPQEVLEMLLYYAIPRRDTGAVAQALLDTFGSLHGVLTASAESLRKVPGMTENAAVMISYLRALYDYDMQEHTDNMQMDAYNTVCAYFTGVYKFEQRETVRAAFLDERLCLKYSTVIAEGRPDASDALVRTVKALSEKTGCMHLILAHNHLSGKAEASAEEIAAARILSQKLREVSVSVVDHIIVSGRDAVSLREQGVFFCLDCSG